MNGITTFPPLDGWLMLPINGTQPESKIMEIGKRVSEVEARMKDIRANKC